MEALRSTTFKQGRYCDGGFDSKMRSRLSSIEALCGRSEGYEAKTVVIMDSWSKSERRRKVFPACRKVSPVVMLNGEAATAQVTRVLRW